MKNMQDNASVLIITHQAVINDGHALNTILKMHMSLSLTVKLLILFKR